MSPWARPVSASRSSSETRRTGPVNSRVSGGEIGVLARVQGFRTPAEVH